MGKSQLDPSSSLPTQRLATNPMTTEPPKASMQPLPPPSSPPPPPPPPSQTARIYQDPQQYQRYNHQPLDQYYPQVMSSPPQVHTVLKKLLSTGSSSSSSLSSSTTTTRVNGMVLFHQVPSPATPSRHSKRPMIPISPAAAPAADSDRPVRSSYVPATTPIPASRIGTITVYHY